MTRRAEREKPRRGFSLLELLIALVVLIAAGLPLLSLSRQSVASDQHAQAAEARLEGANALLNAHALLRRRDLDIRLGERTVGSFIVRVARPEASLFRVAVVDTTPDRPELLVAVFYTPDDSP